MNLGELRTELMDRGFDFFTQDAAGVTRANRFVNGGRAEIDRMHLWPWRQSVASGAAPLVISDLGPIRSVEDASGVALRRSDYAVDWSSGSPAVALDPASTASITVNYWRVTPDLSADTDTPVSPSEAHYLIVDLAVRRAYRDTDNHDAAVAIQGEIDRQMDALLFQYPPGQHDGPDGYVAIGFASEDW